MLALLVDITLQRLNSFKFDAVKSVVSHHGGFWAPYIVWLCFTMGYASLSAYLVTSFAPLGAGSGIPEIKTYLNGVHIKGNKSRVCICFVAVVVTPNRHLPQWLLDRCVIFVTCGVLSIDSCCRPGCTSAIDLADCIW